MIFPNKYEKLSDNAIVVGAEIIRILNSEKEYTANDLYEELKDRLSLLKYIDVLTFLRMMDIIKLDKEILKLNNETQ